MNKENKQTKIEEFIFEITETEEYKNIEYLVHSIRKYFLDYLSRIRLEKFKAPSFLLPLMECVKKRFCSIGVTESEMLNYMLSNDKSGWVMYYYMAFFRSTKKAEEINESSLDENLFYIVLCGYIFDLFAAEYTDINKILRDEKYIYEKNQYNLTKVSGARFKRDSLIYDNKAYLYNILLNTAVINFADPMPGFAKIITEEVTSGDVLFRLDERLALPEKDMITYSSLDFQKYRGPQFSFKKDYFNRNKTIIVHIDENTLNKLLMVVKKDFDTKANKEFIHVEVETLPNYGENFKDRPCITTFVHGMYFFDEDIFTHIDYARNQYEYHDYRKKYLDVCPDVPIDFYAEKQLHYKIWCIENGRYSKEIWYKLLYVSLSNGYRVLLDEMLESN